MTNLSEEVRIVDYHPRFQEAYKRLNEEWITRWFTLEPGDYKALDTPQQSILDPGGAILIATVHEKAVGTCALVRMVDDTFEMAKMSVSEEARGKGIGRLLGEAAIAKARSLGAKRLYLESNRKLAPAISLYRKLGFREIEGKASPYARVDIYMELILH